jgi:hypothetical protein
MSAALHAKTRRGEMNEGNFSASVPRRGIISTRHSNNFPRKLGLPQHVNHTKPDSMELVMDAIVEVKK